MYSIARNTDSTPQAALPRVMKSARWKPRIIEKWRGVEVEFIKAPGC